MDVKTFTFMDTKTLSINVVSDLDWKEGYAMVIRGWVEEKEGSYEFALSYVVKVDEIVYCYPQLNVSLSKVLRVSILMEPYHHPIGYYQE